MLAHAEFREVSRFVHRLTGRVIATDDLGMYVADAIEQFCDGAIDVWDEETEGFEVRTRGLKYRSASWTQVPADGHDKRQRRS